MQKALIVQLYRRTCIEQVASEKMIATFTAQHEEIEKPK